MNNHYFYPGQLVISGGSGSVFRVKKVNPKNLVCIGSDGKSCNVRKDFARPAPDGTEFAVTVTEEELTVPTVRLVLGSTVRFKGAGGAKFPGTYVLIAHPQRGSERARFAKLGGDGDRYVRASLTSVEKVDV